MNTERLQVLITVLEAGSLSAAAERLGFTPSGISRMMASLEEEAGFPLLVRSKEGVKPTEELHTLLPSIRTYLYEGRKLREKADAIRGIAAGSITIGCAYSGVYENLGRAIADFRARHPGISFQLQSGFTEELLSKLRGREIDLCISTVREKSAIQEDSSLNEESGRQVRAADSASEAGICWKHIGRDEMVFWVPAGSALAQQKSLPLSILETEPYIDIYPGKDIDNNRILKKKKIYPNTQFAAMDSYTAYSMAGAGLGIAMNSRLNSTYAGEKVKIVPIHPTIFLEIGLACLKDSSPAVDRFLHEELSCLKKE